MTDAQGHWVHDLDPFIWRFDHSEFGVRWYGLAYLAGIVLGALLLARWSRRGRLPLRAAEVQDFAVTVGLSMVIGGRLGYCLLYGLTTWLHDPLYVLRVWEGGMASHGGIAGLFVGCWLFARSRKRDLLVLCDGVCAVAPIGVIAGRIANFINGELWGRVSNVPWAVIFPTELDAPERLKGEQLRLWQQAHWQFAPPRHPSQLYAVVLEGIIPLIIILPLHARHRRPGLTMGLLLILYGIGRFIDEFFRMPDAGQPGSDPAHPPILGFMSKGQFYTLPVILIGIAIAIIVLRRPARPQAYAAPDASPTPDPSLNA